MLSNKSSIKYFIYARKSSEDDDRQILSINSQIDSVKELALKLGLDIIDVLQESKSAKKPGRDVFNSLLERIESGEAQGILCWKLDRLARNPIDGSRVQWMLQNSVIVHILTPEREYLPTDNVLLMGIEFGMANQYILDLSKNVKRGLTDKVKQGWMPGVAKTGYLNTKSAEKGANTIIKDELRFPLIRQALDLMLTGIHSPVEILNKLNNEWGYRTIVKKKKGGKPMSRSTIYRIFTDPFYYGRFEYPKNSGNWYTGSHEPMITEDEFWLVQKLLGREGRPRPQKHKFPYTGLIVCGECGSMVTASDKVKINKGDGRKHFYTYYNCTKRKKGCSHCGQGAIEVRELEKQIDEYLAQIEIPDDFKNWALKYLGEVNDEEIKDRTHIRKSQQETYNNIQGQIDTLTQMRIKGQLTDEEYDTQRENLLSQRDKLKSQLSGTEERADNWRELTEKTFDFACQARYWFKNGDTETKKIILSTIGWNLNLKDRKLNMDIQKPFEIVKNGYKEISIIPNWLEPIKTITNKEKTGVLSPACSVLRADRV